MLFPFQNKPRGNASIRVLMWSACCLLLMFMALVSPAQAQEPYNPQFQKISYRPDVPALIRRTAKQIGPTRFFGTFKRGDKTFALHFYDQTAVRRSAQYRFYGGPFERISRLDVFQLQLSKSWRRIQSSSVLRTVPVFNRESDKIRIEAQWLWLDPKHKTIPLIYLKVMQKTDRLFIGSLTDIYSVVGAKSASDTSITFNGDHPSSMNTVAYSEISYPDEKGHLTLVFTESDPGQTLYTSYGWSGKKWEQLKTVEFDNNPEKVLRWDGRNFISVKR